MDPKLNTKLQALVDQLRDAIEEEGGMVHIGIALPPELGEDCPTYHSHGNLQPSVFRFLTYTFVYTMNNRPPDPECNSEECSECAAEAAKKEELIN